MMAITRNSRNVLLAWGRQQPFRNRHLKSLSRTSASASPSPSPSPSPSTSDDDRRGVEESARILGWRREDLQQQLHLAREKLMRQPRHSFDYLSPTHARLLSVALDDYMPAELRLRHVSPELLNYKNKLDFLPHGYHLVYFPPLMRETELLPDGTDPGHHPGPPFTRRMWAGGSVQFLARTKLRGQASVCEERVTDIKLRAGKAFVELERKYYVMRATSNKLDHYLTEQRTLVFLPPKDDKASPSSPTGQDVDGERDAEQPRRIVRAAYEPDYSFEITPSQRLLFHFSALSYNSHAIHLDPQYAREVEGHTRGLLVHGPLSVILMLTALKSQMGLRAAPREALSTAKLDAAVRLDAGPAPDTSKEQLWSIDYRNLAPLYAGKRMRVCVRQKGEPTPAVEVTKDCQAGPTFHQSWDLWIEGPDGGLTVKATAVTEIKSRRPPPQKAGPLAGPTIRKMMFHRRNLGEINHGVAAAFQQNPELAKLPSDLPSGDSESFGEALVEVSSGKKETESKKKKAGRRASPATPSSSKRTKKAGEAASKAEKEAWEDEDSPFAALREYLEKMKL